MGVEAFLRVMGIEDIPPAAGDVLVGRGVEAHELVVFADHFARSAELGIDLHGQDAVVVDDAMMSQMHAAAFGEDIAVRDLKILADAHRRAIAAAFEQPRVVDANSRLTHAEPVVGHDALTVIARKIKAHFLNAVVGPVDQRFGRRRFIGHFGARP